MYCTGSNVCLVALNAFALPDEPFMRVTRDQEGFVVGAARDVVFATGDASVQMVVGDIPDGAERTANGFRWSPSGADVGEVTVEVTLSYNDIERTERFPFTVSQPSLKAPFSVGDLAINEAGDRALCWSKRMRDSFGRPVGGETESQFAVVDLNGGGAETRAKKLPYEVKKAVFRDGKVAFLPALDSSRVDVYDANTLERVKTVLGSAIVKDIKVQDGGLCLVTSSGSDLYDLTTFKKSRVSASAGKSAGAGSAGSGKVFKDGILRGAVFFGESGDTPNLLLASSPFIRLNGGSPRLESGSFLRKAPVAKSPGRSAGHHNHRFSMDGKASSPRVDLPGRDTKAPLEYSRTNVNVPGATHTRRLKESMSVVFYDQHGSRLEQLPVFNKVSPQASGGSRNAPSLKLVSAGEHVVCAWGERLYRIALPAAEETSADEESTEILSEEFHIQPEQSAFVISSTETSVLKHKVSGGGAPFEFFALSEREGITMDSATGDLKVDGAVLAKAAQEAVISSILDRSQPGGESAELRNHIIKCIDPFRNLTKRRPTGIPVAVPIWLKVLEDGGEVSEMQYYVLLEVPGNETLALAKKRVAAEGNPPNDFFALGKKPVPPTVRRPPTVPPPPAILSTPTHGTLATPEIQRLEKRIDSIEAKLDLLLERLPK